MVRLPVIFFSVFLAVACAETPVQSAPDPTAGTKTAKACDEEPVTGSRIRRCDRTDNVEVISREQFERMTTRSGLAPVDGMPVRR